MPLDGVFCVAPSPRRRSRRGGTHARIVCVTCGGTRFNNRSIVLTDVRIFHLEPSACYARTRARARAIAYRPTPSRRTCAFSCALRRARRAAAPRASRLAPERGVDRRARGRRTRQSAALIPGLSAAAAAGPLAAPPPAHVTRVRQQVRAVPVEAGRHGLLVHAREGGTAAAARRIDGLGIDAREPSSMYSSVRARRRIARVPPRRRAPPPPPPRRARRAARPAALAHDATTSAAARFISSLRVRGTAVSRSHAGTNTEAQAAAHRNARVSPPPHARAAAPPATTRRRRHARRAPRAPRAPPLGGERRRKMQRRARGPTERRARRDPMILRVVVVCEDTRRSCRSRAWPARRRVERGVARARARAALSALAARAGDGDADDGAIGADARAPTSDARVRARARRAGQTAAAASRRRRRSTAARSARRAARLPRRASKKRRGLERARQARGRRRELRRRDDTLF